MYDTLLKFYPCPDLIVQYCSVHEGVVKNLKDPLKLGRVKVEVPGLLDGGKENWTDWLIMTGNPCGTSKGPGDEGLWWPMQVGQHVAVAFMAGDPFAMWALPGSPPADGDKPLIPAEPKSYDDGRKATRCRVIKSEAGHTDIWDDNGKSELYAKLSWAGSGLAFHGPGKEEDEQETEDEESKPRKGERRGTKNVFSGTSKKPSELLEGGAEYVGLLDLCAKGLLSYANDKEEGGYLCLGSKSGPNIVLDSKNNCIFLTVGDCQIQMFGDTKPGRIFVTKQMVVKSKLVEVAGYFSKVINAIGKRLKKYDG